MPAACGDLVAAWLPASATWAPRASSAIALCGEGPSGIEIGTGSEPHRPSPRRRSS